VKSGVWAGQCTTASRRWNCFSEQILLQPHSVVSDGSVEDVMSLAADTLLLWVLKWRQEGSTKDGSAQVHPRLAGTPGNVERIRDAIL
jgi:hypothetical protein